MWNDIIFPFVTFIGGFFAKHLFDNRDFRRKLIEEDFIKFSKECSEIRDKYILYSQELMNHGENELMTVYSESCKEKVKELGNNLKYSLSVLSETKAAANVEQIVDELRKAMLGSDVFYQKRFNEEGRYQQGFKDFLDNAIAIMERLRSNEWIVLNRRVYFVLTSFFWWEILRYLKFINNKICSK